MTEPSGVPTPIVDKLVDTIKEFNKQVSDSNLAINECAKDISILAEVTKKLSDQINTPPRIIEVHEKSTKILSKIEEKDGVLDTMSSIKTLITSALSEVKSAFAIIAVAIVVAAIVTVGVNYYMDKTSKAAVSIEERDNLKVKIDELNKKIEEIHGKGKQQ